MTIKDCQKIAQEIRRSILEISYRVQGHHLGSALSIVDLMTVLYFRTLRLDPQNPKRRERDYFILSKGHASLVLYIALAKRGFFSETDLLAHYGQDGGQLGCHPDKDNMPGIEATTGSLGHGLSVGAGLALAAKSDCLPCRAFVMLGDGECNEGGIWEAAMFAGHHKLDNLIAIIDYNHLQGFGRTEEVLDLEPLADKWRAFGWGVKEVDGHSMKEITAVFDRIPFQKNRPNVVIANTIKGKGVSFLENRLESHYKKINRQELEIALKDL